MLLSFATKNYSFGLNPFYFICYGKGKLLQDGLNCFKIVECLLLTREVWQTAKMVAWFHYCSCFYLLQSDFAATLHRRWDLFLYPLLWERPCSLLGVVVCTISNVPVLSLGLKRLCCLCSFSWTSASTMRNSQPACSRTKDQERGPELNRPNYGLLDWTALSKTATYLSWAPQEGAQLK